MNYLLTIRQALKYLNIKSEQLLDLIDHHDLPVIRLGNELRFRSNDLDTWIDNNAHTASRDPELAAMVENALDAMGDTQDDGLAQDSVLGELAVSDPFLFHVRENRLILKIFSVHEAELIRDQILHVMQELCVEGNHAAQADKAMAAPGEDCDLGPCPDRLRNEFHILVTPDTQNAFAFITPDLEMAPMVDGEILLEKLHAAGVTYGLDMGVIKTCSHPDARGRLLHVVRGVPPRAKGEPDITYHFDTVADFKPRVMESPSFDFNSYKSISNATKDQILTEIILPRDIRNGVDVYGEPIPYAVNAARSFKGGPNTYLSHNGLRLHAACDGIAYWKNDAVCVDSTRFLQNVGYETGNVHFDGRVIVQNNVVRGFSITAQRKVVVKGQVEADTAIQSDSSVNILGGIKGGGTADIRAKASVTTRFAEACSIASDHTIHVDTAVIRCKLKAAKSIQVKGNDSRVSASELTAGQNIRVVSAGSQNHEPVLLKIEQLTDDLSGSERVYFENLLDKINDEIKYSKTRIRRYKEQGSKAVDKEQKHLAALNKLLEKEQGAFDRFLEWSGERDTIFVEITGAVFPGVTVQIEDKTLENTKLTKGIRVFYSTKGLQQEALENSD